MYKKPDFLGQQKPGQQQMQPAKGKRRQRTELTEEQK